jgi:hypothetical protein
MEQRLPLTPAVRRTATVSALPAFLFSCLTCDRSKRKSLDPWRITS